MTVVLGMLVVTIGSVLAGGTIRPAQAKKDCAERSKTAGPMSPLSHQSLISLTLSYPMQVPGCRECVRGICVIQPPRC